jgi:hypothetical protein
MIYLRIEHTDGDDADYLKFSGLKAATDYLIMNQAHDWIMTDTPFEEFPLDDYTFVR